MSGDTPAPVPYAVITAIRSRERNGYVVLPRPRGFRSGDRVRVRYGLLEGQHGIFAASAGERVVVLLAMVGSTPPSGVASGCRRGRLVPSRCFPGASPAELLGKHIIK